MRHMTKYKNGKYDLNLLVQNQIDRAFCFWNYLGLDGGQEDKEALGVGLGQLLDDGMLIEART